MEYKHKSLLTRILTLLIESGHEKRLTQNECQSIAWADFLSVAQYHGIHTLMFPLLKDIRSCIPPECYCTLKEQYLEMTHFAAYASKIFFSIKKIFDASGIPFVPIKGMAHMCELYHSLPGRAMCDLDILITEEDYERAKSRLSDIQYEAYMSEDEERYWRECQMHVHFLSTDLTKPECWVEVHWRLDYQRSYPILPYLWSRVREVSYTDTPVTLLSPEDTLFSLALHQRRFGSPLQLKYALDTALLFKRYKSTLDVEYLIAESRRSRTQTSLYALLRQCSEIYNDSDIDEITNKLQCYGMRGVALGVLVKKYSFTQPYDIRALFLVLHLFLFDDLREPLLYMLSIPFEQFCKYYHLAINNKKSRVLYQIRHFYALYRFFISIAKHILPKKIN